MTKEGEKMDAAGQVIQDAIEKAGPLVGKRQYAGVISAAGTKLAKAVAQQNIGIISAMKKKIGAPTRLTKKLAEDILRRVEHAETLGSIAKALDLDLATIYKWLDTEKTFAEGYNRSKSLMAKTLVEKLVDETATLQNDQALAARVRADVVKWVAARYSPQEFGDTKRIELKGEISHTHVHQLEEHQKRKIAEAWLASQSLDTPGIVAETTGPDIESGAVREICTDDQGVHPERKRTSKPPALPKPVKRGRKPKVDLDKPIDSVD
jgi:hypothetical protein